MQTVKLWSEQNICPPPTSWWHRRLLPGSCGRRWRSGTPEGSAGTCRSWSFCTPGNCKKEVNRELRSYSMCGCLISCCVQIKYSHLRGFGFVLPVKKLWQSSALNGMNTVGEISTTLWRLTAETHLNDSLLTFWVTSHALWCYWCYWCSFYPHRMISPTGSRIFLYFFLYKIYYIIYIILL